MQEVLLVAMRRSRAWSGKGTAEAGGDKVIGREAIKDMQCQAIEWVIHMETKVTRNDGRNYHKERP